MAIRRRAVQASVEEESVFVSMTDMMVGMLFLFILMLMFFALKFNEAAVRTQTTVKQLLSAEDTRRIILSDVKKAMQDQGIAVEIDVENGILRLPENVLFDRGQADLSGRGQDAVGALARSLSVVMPCYATVPGAARPTTCPDTPHTIEAVFVEGHTDSDGSDALNWGLSVQRSLSTYQAMTEAQPELAMLKNTRDQTVLSVSGYGKFRPVRPNDSDDHKSQNRRIDLRFIMTSPKVDQIEDVERQVEENYQ